MSLFLGVVLIVLSAFYIIRGCYAFIKGQIDYRSGFIPMSILSTFFIPPWGSLKSPFRRTKDALWVHAVAPMIIVLAFCMLVAGLDYAGLPASAFVNYLTIGERQPPLVVFDQKNGYDFPAIRKVHIRHRNYQILIAAPTSSAKTTER